MKKFAAMLKEHVTIIFVLLIVALSAGIGLFFIYTNQTKILDNQQTEIAILKRDLRTKESDLTLLNQDKEVLIKQIAQAAVENNSRIAELNARINELNSKLELSFTLPDYVLEGLIKHGYNTPKQLLEDLAKHDALIPIKGILGGTMRWWPEYSAVLNEKYVFGYYEDGHILGYALLKYSFDQEDNLTWQIVDSYTD